MAAASLPKAPSVAALPEQVGSPLMSALLILIIGVLSVISWRVWLFPSLGPTIYLQTERPADPSSRFYNTMLGHLLGLAAGFAGVFLLNAHNDPVPLVDRQITWARVGTAVVALGLTLLLALLLKASHPPAGATTLLTALGSIKTVQDVINLTIGVLLVAVTGEVIRRMRTGNLTHQMTIQPKVAIQGRENLSHRHGAGIRSPGVALREPKRILMLRQIRLLLGISVFWLALSMLLDGVNTLVLPVQISNLSSQATRATTLGLLTFVGLLMGAFVQPVAGAISDRWKPVLGRKGFIGIGLALILLSLFFFAVFDNPLGVILGYLFIQISASIAQAGQQSLIPDFIEEKHRGMASGLKGFMDMAGAMLGFVILGQLLGASHVSLALGVLAAILVGTWLLAALFTPEDKPSRNRTGQAEGISLTRLFRLDLTQQAAFKSLLAARFLFLFGVYAIGRFLLFFVAERLGLDPNQAAEQAGLLLGGLAFVTILASPLTGWLTDRFGRVPLMIIGALLGATGALLLIWAHSSIQILLFGSLMSLGSAAFGSGSWAMLADVIPRKESARYFGLANFSTAGPTAAAGLLGPAIDWVNQLYPGNGYVLLFIVSAIAFAVSILPLRNLPSKYGERNENREKDSAHASGLAVLPVPADPAGAEKDHQDPPGGTAQL